VPEPVINLLFALLFIVVPVIPVRLDPSPLNDVAVHIPVTTTPVLVVTNLVLSLKLRV